MAVEQRFDFEQWLNDYQLTEIKQCLIDHNMTTPNMLDMNHANFSTLMAEQTILSNAHLIPNIVNAIQSLHASPADQQKIIQRRLIFLSPTESSVFCNLEQYMTHLTALQEEFSDRIQTGLTQRKQSNTADLEQFSTKNTAKLTAIRGEVTTTMQKLHDVLDENEKRIKEEMHKYRNTVKYVHQMQVERVREIENAFNASISMMQQDMKHYHSSLKQCEGVVQKYVDLNNDNDDDDDNGHYRELTNNKNREQEIINIGENVTSYFNKNGSILQEYRKRIDQYLAHQLVLNMKQMHSAFINDKMYKQICSNINTKLIVLRDDVNSSAPNNGSQRVQPMEPPQVQIRISPQSSPKPVPPSNNRLEASLSESAIIGIKRKQNFMQPEPQSVSPSDDDAKQNYPPPPYNPNPIAVKKKGKPPQKSHSFEQNEPPPAFSVHRDSLDVIPSKEPAEAIDGGIGIHQQAFDVQVAQRIEKTGRAKEFGKFWVCAICTFSENPGSYLVCNMCGSTRQLSMQISRQRSMSAGGEYDHPPVKIAQSTSHSEKDSASAQEDSKENVSVKSLNVSPKKPGNAQMRRVQSEGAHLKEEKKNERKKKGFFGFGGKK
eukprot:CAMPEP_0197038028 /NCGR_PEP_ID=MMETSP1384-20130603/15081_1 /TAXON_ID=29189 /ORGANISM="Ammonia sp." /LENGTH=601 /DNA_ID=CAMNT_0042468419 /DNA_START=53 /DNA_END=1858 /DNA_ORIENTATION=+